METLYEKIRAGNTLALSKMVTAVEEDRPEVEDLLEFMLSDTNKSHIIGITGPPGSGKSTMVDQLIKEYRSAGLKVGVVAIDPSSPFSQGAVLGDRVRMQRHNTDEGVFIRSMATRNAKGGLAEGIRHVIKLLEVSGKDIILIETVGVGQIETEVVSIADTVIVTTVPGLGDSMQSIKAGLMEIGDIFVVNMADRPDADKMVAQLQSSLHMIKSKKQWNPKVRKTVALTGEGIPDLVKLVEQHYQLIQANGELENHRLKQWKDEIWVRLEKRIIERLHESITQEQMMLIAEEVSKGKIRLGMAVNQLSNQFLERKINSFIE